MLRRTQGGDLTIYFENAPLTVRSGDSVALGLLASGVMATRGTAVSGAPRGPYCMMGACFECLADVDGRQNVQTCMTPVREGMRVRRQDGVRDIGPGMAAPAGHGTA